ncbi:hypothetical protein HYS30_02670, partial [Candidatus Peregrinibacteria bacterium]|nr:hypothetical protein [Candidatus Peregrinibacteria bacterium]
PPLTPPPCGGEGHLTIATHLPFSRARGKGLGDGGSSAQWHAALMDCGSRVCTKRNPVCHRCPLVQGICRSAFRVDRVTSKRATNQREPGRQVGGRFVPNRIFRGKVIDLLRDHPQGLMLEAIGRQICLDWSQEHREWLQGILTNLQKDSLLGSRGKKYVLS